MHRGLLCFLFLGTAISSASAQEFVVSDRLGLDEALRLARERNPSIAAARNAVEMAQADRLAAGVRPNPAFTVESGNYPLFEPARPPFLDNQELTLRLDQEIELAGRRRLRTETADAGV